MIIGTDERCAQLLANLQAARVGQTKVEQYKVSRRCRQCSRGRSHDSHIEALPAKAYRQSLTDGFIVFNNEDLHCPLSFPQLLRRLGRDSTADMKGR